MVFVNEMPEEMLKDQVKKGTVERFEYDTFTYDEAGRQTKVSVGGQDLSETFYNPDGTAEKTVYGNSAAAAPQQVKYRYDGYKRLC